MAVPKQKTSPSKRGMRRSHDQSIVQSFVEDKKSGEFRRPHHIDLSTGMYRGKQIIIKKTKKKASENVEESNQDVSNQTIIDAEPSK